jgi:class 3 adenylate cyclase
MHDIVVKGINPQLKSHGLPELRIKISIEYGEVQVVLYGKSLERSHIDVIGPSISTAAKMISFASNGQTVIGEQIFQILHNVMSESNFVKLDADTSKWSHIQDGQARYSLFLLNNQ